jgi:hypothetical protein
MDSLRTPIIIFGILCLPFQQSTYVASIVHSLAARKNTIGEAYGFRKGITLYNLAEVLDYFPI